MSGIGNQIFGVLCAAISVSILTTLVPDGTYGKLMKLVGGLFLSLTVATNFLKLDLDLLESIPAGYMEAADQAVAGGELLAQDALRGIIKEETEAYILDKARVMDLEIDVEVTVDRGEPSVPQSVKISGNLTQEEQKILTDFLELELNIPKERQQWISGC